MTRQGLGISILPKLAAQPIPKSVQIAQLPFSLARPLGISWLKDGLLTPSAYAFLEGFKDLYGKRSVEREETAREVESPVPS
jgi:DNA-binding transcriptional LysR family regulator